MKTFSAISLASFVVAAGAAFQQAVHADFNAYENSRHPLTGLNKPGVHASFGSEWIGQAINLSPASPSLQITGIDAAFYFTGTKHYNAGEVRIRVRLYDTFTPSSASVFSNLRSEQIVLSTSGFTGAPSGFSPANYPVGATANTPYWKFTTPVAVPAFGPIGIAYTFETLVNGTWASDANLAAISFGDLHGPTSGSTAMSQGTGFFHASIQSATPGNFAPSDYTNATFANPGSFSGLDMRVWTAVPTPATGTLALFGVLFACRRRR